MSDDTVRKLTTYIGAGLTPTQALDVYMLRDADFTVKPWAAIRGVKSRVVRSSVERASETLGGLDPDEVVGAETRVYNGGDDGGSK